MAELNHFAISAALGSTLGPRVRVHPGALGGLELSATIDLLMHNRKDFIEDVDLQDDLTKKYEKAVTRAYLSTRQTFSSDRVLADPAINAAFIKACRDFGVDDTVFHLNLALIGLRKHNKLKAKSEKSVVADQWRYAVASEIAARAMYYRYHVTTEDIQQSVISQQTITEADLFERDLWHPNPDRLAWQYVSMPESHSDYRFGVVRSLVGKWKPVFNIPRGEKRKKRAA